MVRVEEEDTFKTVISDKQHQASVLQLAEKGDDVEGNKTKGKKQKVNLTGKATEEGEELFGKENEKALQHPFVREEFLNKAAVNAPVQQGQHSLIPMAANLLVLEADGTMDERCSNMSHEIESIVEDSEGLMQDRLQAHNEALSKENPIVNKATEEYNINIQRQPIFLSGPVVIGSKSKWRASQLEGINLQVELDPRSQRKSLRSQLYEDCMSSGEGEVPNTQERLQNLVQSELNITKEAGRRLGVEFSELDSRMMKNMIESETNKFFIVSLECLSFFSPGGFEPCGVCFLGVSRLPYSCSFHLQSLESLPAAANVLAMLTGCFFSSSYQLPWEGYEVSAIGKTMRL
ncbi:hypothetical protein RHGRI_021308 [Rhododendron griersonianum]|uniref:Uncharacterized protein n=1 Tax=Rhododendron griersonianum TaxID=479676 RepID=A0AAV6JQ31_9ERIC|nr:hypothetical protein RHGRI_021308 [Rhododendron griersonianum]